MPDIKHIVIWSDGDINVNATAGSIGSLANTSSPSTPGTTGFSVNASSTSTVSTGSNSASRLGSTDSLSNTSKPENESKHEPFQAGLGIGVHNNLENTTSPDVSSGSVKAENAAHSQRRLLQENDSKEAQEGSSDSHAKENDMHAAGAKNQEGLEEEADASFDLFRDAEDLADEYNYDYDDYVDSSMWGDEEWIEGKHEKLEDYVNIDSHILCTPVSIIC